FLFTLLLLLRTHMHTTFFPYTTLFRSGIKILLQRFKPAIEELIGLVEASLKETQKNQIANAEYNSRTFSENLMVDLEDELSDLKDRKSTRLNSSHDSISYAVFCLKKRK